MQKESFKIITNAFRAFYSVPYAYFQLVYLRCIQALHFHLFCLSFIHTVIVYSFISILFSSSINIQLSSIESMVEIYNDIMTPSVHGKLSCVTPRDARVTHRVARLLSWRLHNILSSSTAIFGSLSFRHISRLAKSISLIASKTNASINRSQHELMTLADSMPGDLADAMASVLPRLVPFAMLRPRFSFQDFICTHHLFNSLSIC